MAAPALRPLALVPIRPGGILALDLASTVGWAHGGLADAAPKFGIWMLPQGQGEGARYAAFENALAAAMDRIQPERLILEAPLPLMAQTQARTAQQQYTLRGIAFAEAWRASVPIMEIDALTVRREVMGQGRFSKDTVKREVVRYCRVRGWRVPDHNAGDACLTWEWLSQRLRGAAPVAGPLFRAATA
jgi:Holliday junction resolvasome RuvABC endonuclease subunit